MLTAECYKKRLEKGLTFLEFNYMLMQAYDFLVLNENYGCQLQLGGDDQWSNMLAGADLIRRKLSKPAFAMPFSLLTTSEGTKMGKTAKGAVWLDENKTPPYDFYQYWRNVDDADVEKCLKLLTFLPVAEIEEMCRFKDQRINDAKVRLAYENRTRSGRRRQGAGAGGSCVFRRRGQYALQGNTLFRKHNRRSDAV